MVFYILINSLEYNCTSGATRLISKECYETLYGCHPVFAALAEGSMQPIHLYQSL